MMLSSSMRLIGSEESDRARGCNSSVVTRGTLARVALAAPAGRSYDPDGRGAAVRRAQGHRSGSCHSMWEGDFEGSIDLRRVVRGRNCCRVGRATCERGSCSRRSARLGRCSRPNRVRGSRRLRGPRNLRARRARHRRQLPGFESPTRCHQLDVPEREERQHHRRKQQLPVRWRQRAATVCPALTRSQPDLLGASRVRAGGLHRSVAGLGTGQPRSVVRRRALRDPLTSCRWVLRREARHGDVARELPRC